MSSSSGSRHVRRLTGFALLCAVVLAASPSALGEVQENPAAGSVGTCDASDLEPLDVVDMHSHFFNLDYLPLRGILYRFSVPWPLAGFLASVLHEITESIDPEHETPASDTLADTEEASFEQFMTYERLSTHMASQLDEADRKGLDRRVNKMRKAAARIRLRDAQEADPSMSDGQRRLETRAIMGEYDNLSGMDMMIELFYQVMRREHGQSVEPQRPDVARIDAMTAMSEPSRSGVVQAFVVLLSREDEILRRAQEDYPEVDLFVNHLVDFRNVYRSRPELPVSKQIDHAAALARRSRTELDFFVAGDSFRRSELLEVVEEGRDKGATGIKFYPPSGARPTDTCRPRRPRFRFPFTASIGRKLQYRRRYRNNGPDILDDRNLGLFRTAARNELPIFSHHNEQGFQAANGYGQLMNAPCHWQAVFDQLREDSPTVILAHAGGANTWFSPSTGERCGGERWNGSFAQQAYNLCVLYPNVYCDFGYSSLVLEEECRPNFEARLRGFIEEGRDASPDNPIPRNLCDYKENAAPRYQIGEKIIYGTDWLVMTEPNRKDLLCRFNEVFKTSDLVEHREDFFGRNARRALEGSGVPPGSLPISASSTTAQSQPPRRCPPLANE